MQSVAAEEEDPLHSSHTQFSLYLQYISYSLNKRSKPAPISVQHIQSMYVQSTHRYSRHIERVCSYIYRERERARAHVCSRHTEDK